MLIQHVTIGRVELYIYFEAFLIPSRKWQMTNNQLLGNVCWNSWCPFTDSSFLESQVLHRRRWRATLCFDLFTRCAYLISSSLSWSLAHTASNSGLMLKNKDDWHGKPGCQTFGGFQFKECNSMKIWWASHLLHPGPPWLYAAAAMLTPVERKHAAQ